MEKAQGANIGVTLACVLTSVCNNQATEAAINVGGSALFAKFSRDDEAQADEEGVKNVVRAGIDPRGIPEMFQILLNERESLTSHRSTRGSRRTRWKRIAFGRRRRRSRRSTPRS